MNYDHEEETEKPREGYKAMKQYHKLDAEKQIQQAENCVVTSEQRRPRKPTIVYVETPKIVYAEAQDFMSVVQRLTGKKSST
ncbi:hypothetical protein Syun_008510 [Stephania yunnanensis]|uniref:VQ domain-containing protein n=1 Tax=Stephania yunnanensis TaxID=152371 RepID=A0AAP0KCP4_9MAGN